MSTLPHRFMPTQWTFLLAAVDQRISEGSMDGQSRETQGNDLGLLLNQEFPQLKLDHKQVTGKLRHLWERYGKHGTKSADVYKKGSRCFHIEHFNPNDLQLFSRARSRLGLPEVQLACKQPGKECAIRSRRLHDSQSSYSPSRSASLDVARDFTYTSENTLQEDKPIESESLEQQLYTQHGENPQIPVLAANDHHEAELPTQLQNAENNMSADGSSIYMSSPIARVVITPGLKDREGAPVESPTGSIPPKKRILVDLEEIPEPATQCDQDSPRKRLKTHETPPLRQVVVLKNKQANVSTDAAENDKIQMLSQTDILNSEAIALLQYQWREELRHSIERLEHKYSQAIESIGQECRQTLDGLRMAIETANGQDILDLAGLRAQTCLAKQQRDAAIRLYQPAPPPTVSRAMIDERIGNIQFFMVETFDNLPKFRLIGALELPIAIEKLLRGVDPALPTVATIKGLRSKFGDVNFMRLLMNSAICQWIFESDFPRFDGDDSVMLNEYRKLLASQKDGLNIVRNLDCLAHSTRIKDYATQKQRIPEEAQKWAKIFSAALAPLFVSDPSSTEIDGFNSWGQSSADWKKRQGRTIATFHDCLKLKADSILTGEKYQLRWISVREKRDGSYTQIDKAVPPMGVSEEPRLCLFPAVYVHVPKQPTGKVLLNHDIDGVVVKSKNFQRVSEESEIIGDAVIYKALLA